MFCQSCGKSLDDSLKFCPSCGKKTDQTAEVNNTQIYENKTTIINDGVKNNDYVEILKKSFNSFIGYFVAVLKNPTTALENANNYLTGKKVLVLTGILALIYSITQCLQLLIFSSGVKAMIKDIAYGSYDESFSPISLGVGLFHSLDTDSINWFKILILGFVFIILFVATLSFLSLVVYNLIMKKDTKFMDYVSMYLSSLILLVITSFVAMVTTAININLTLVIMGIGALLYIISITVNFVNYLKNEMKVIYTFPIIIFLSLYISYFIYIKLL